MQTRALAVGALALGATATAAAGAAPEAVTPVVSWPVAVGYALAGAAGAVARIARGTTYCWRSARAASEAAVCGALGLVVGATPLLAKLATGLPVIGPLIGADVAEQWLAAPILRGALVFLLSYAGSHWVQSMGYRREQERRRQLEELGRPRQYPPVPRPPAPPRA